MGRNEEEIENRMENKRFRIVFEKKKKGEWNKELTISKPEDFWSKNSEFC